MKKEPLVSIVVPVYNQEKYLDISIPSLQAQEYTNLEIVLVDDGSKDNSYSILERYANQDNRIKIVKKVNGGLVDATIAGIQKSTGEFIAFLDPDDYIGSDFILNLMGEMQENYDFVAAGFYYDNNGTLSPYALSADCLFDKDKIAELPRQFLLSEYGADIPHTLFFSRWNKLYRMSCVKKVVKEFVHCKGVTLGEDTIFTYLMLKNSNAGKTLRLINSYFYNVGNQNSMMKNGAVETHLHKAEVAFQLFSDTLKSYGDPTDQAYALYYYLVESLFQRIIQQNSSEFKRMYCFLRKNKTYKKALRLLSKHARGIKQKIVLTIRLSIASPNLYLKSIQQGVQVLKKINMGVLDGKFLLESFINNGPQKAAYAYRFRLNRRNAFKDLQKQLLELEKRIVPFLGPYLGKETNFSECPVERNVFVFWWDGFDYAPPIVKQCLNSIKKYHLGCRVIEISKDDYEDFTDINPVILRDFRKGKISIQTFSDILRFNLLKNNGGIWIDATIYFADSYNLLDKLKDKAVESVCFASSADFLKYKDEECSWSGYFLASRKNSVFVQAVDYIFEQYYLKYHTYSIYFFIDATLMICKLYHLDNGALAKVHKNPHDMFLLAKLLDKTYNESCVRQICVIPQKLAWFYQKHNLTKDSFYNCLFVDSSL